MSVTGLQKFLKLFRVGSHSQGVPNRLSEGDEALWSRVENYFGKNYHRSTLTLDEVQVDLGISKDRLVELIRQNARLSVKEYLLVKRMRKALELLDQGKLSLDEIALKVGFSDPSQIYRLLKEEGRDGNDDFFNQIRSVA